MNGDPYNSIGETLKNVVKLGVKKKPTPEEKPDWWLVRKIARLGGIGKFSHIRVDPVQVAAATLEKAKAGRIKSVYVSMIWDDGTMAVDYCQMKHSELCQHAFNVQREVNDVINK